MDQEAQVSIKPNALNELESAFDYYAENYSPEYAEKFRVDFYNQEGKIQAHFLGFGECRFLPTRRRIYRNLSWGDYLIICKIKPASIKALSLFHTKRDPRRLKRLRRVK